MYCLNCGTKINDDESQCPNCGSSVAEMKERIAAAEEMVVYTDAVDSSDTHKLPLVKDRTYVDRDGNPLDPSKEVDVLKLKHEKADLTAIPEIGDKEDPFVTKPMQRIVTDDGKEVAGADNTPRQFRQDEPPIKTRTKVIIIIACLALAFCMIWVNANTWLNALHIQLPWKNYPAETSDATSDNQQPDQSADEYQQNEASTEDTAAEARDAFGTALEQAYADLGQYREQVDAAVDNFEGYLSVKNRDTRSKYADACSSLVDALSKSKQTLDDQWSNSGLPESDALYEKYQTIDQLFDYLAHRLDVIHQCWQVSLTFDNPASHTDEILAPLKQDISGGKSASEAAFDAEYPKADPKSDNQTDA
ncbi:MAG: zinc ribbon domain-containing protein [Eggerthellaceae bacterium]